jgi:hypothetical protein
MDELTAKKFSEAVDYLHSYNYFKRRIDWLRDNIETLESSLDAVTSFSHVRVQQSGDPYRREKLLAEIADKKKELQERKEGLELQGLEVLNTISKIPDPRISKVLMLEYVQGMSQEQIREKYNNELPLTYWYDGIMMVVKILDQKEQITGSMTA